MILLEPGEPLSVADKLAWPYAENSGDVLNRGQRGALQATLNLADVGAVEVSSLAKTLLREPELLTSGPNRLAEGLLKSLRGGPARHRGRMTQCRLSLYSL